MWDVKDVNFQEVQSTNIQSFTLTMWDVKVLYTEDYLLRHQFYLNYVGCKVRKLDSIN